MGTSLVDAESLLALDIGSVHTRALLFDEVEGQYSFIGVGVSPSTAAAPFADISQGVFQALHHLQEITGRVLLSESDQLVLPSQPDGAGVDRLVVTFSAGRELQIATVGLLTDVSLESANRLAASTYGRVVESIGLNDRRRSDSQMDAVLRAGPDLVIIAGGAERGATRSVVKLTELVSLICRVLPEDRRPELLYAGNSALAKKVEEYLQKWARVRTAPNVRPTIDSEDLGPAQDVLAEMVGQMRSRQLSGLSQLAAVSGEPPLPGAHTLGRMVRFLGQVYDPAKGVLGVDLGAAHTTLAASLDGDFQLAVSPVGMGSGLKDLLAQTDLAELMRWLPMVASPDDVRDYLHQKTLYPGSLPLTAETLAFEQAAARLILRAVAQNLMRRWPDQSLSFEPILVGGAALSKAPALTSALMTVLDGLQPVGISTIILDQHGLLPSLGAAAAVNTLLPVQVLESNAFLNLGTVIAPLCDARYGTPVLAVRLEHERGRETRLEVRQGSLVRLPLHAGEAARIHLTPLRHMEIDPRRRGGSNSFKIVGGACGAVIDARGRPLNLPKDDARRRDLLKKWAAALEKA